MTTVCQQKSHHVSEFAHCVFEYLAWSVTVTRWPDGCWECIRWENNGEKSFHSNQIELSLSNTVKCVYCCCARLALFVPLDCFSQQCK